MCPATPLEAYAEEICSSAKLISGYCSLEGYSHPSFDPQAPLVTLPPDAPLNVRQARQKIIDSSSRIQQLATEPSEYLPNLAVQYQRISCIRWLCHFQVMACIPLQGSVCYADVASISNVPERQLRSIARMAMTSGFLCEPQLGEVAHNATSRLFVKNPALLGWTEFMTRFYMPVASKFADATEKYQGSDKNNETAVNIAMDTELSSFDFITRDKELGRHFGAYMKGVQASEGTNFRHVISGYDWESLGDGFVVHIGGAPGSICIALAEAFPRLRVIAQDMPDVIANSPNLSNAQPKAIRNRIKTFPHNFFHPQPIRNANVYLMRMVLHNHTDDESVEILSNLVPALKSSPSARLLIMDTVLPNPGSVGAVDEALMRYRDLTMMQVFNTKERELGEFEELFEKASSAGNGNGNGNGNGGEGRLVLKKMGRAVGSALSMMEVAWESSLTNGTTTGHLTNGVNGINGTL